MAVPRPMALAIYEIARAPNEGDKCVERHNSLLQNNSVILPVCSRAIYCVREYTSAPLSPGWSGFQAQ